MKKFTIVIAIIMTAMFVFGICAMSNACAAAQVEETIVFENVEVIAIAPVQAGTLAIVISIDNEEFVFYWDAEFYFNKSVSVEFYTFGTIDHAQWEIIDARQK